MAHGVHGFALLYFSFYFIIFFFFVYHKLLGRTNVWNICPFSSTSLAAQLILARVCYVVIVFVTLPSSNMFQFIFSLSHIRISQTYTKVIGFNGIRSWAFNVQLNSHLYHKNVVSRKAEAMIKYRNKEMKKWIAIYRLVYT